MTKHHDWIAEQPRRGWLSRLLAPEAHARPNTSAFVVGILAAVAYVVSLTTEWLRIGIPPTGNDGSTGPNGTSFTISSGVSSAEMLGLVYALVMIAQLALTGAVVNRADLALRLRLATSAVGVGLVGVVFAVTHAIPSGLGAQFGARLPTNAMVSYHPGMMCALAAALLPAVAVWLASQPAARSARAVARRVEPVGFDEVSQIEVVSVAPAQRAWAVRPEEPLDLTVTPER